jgi:asparagine synthase (glutamine-hydrolysing)
MCGILGQFAGDGRLQSIDALSRLVGTLAHRGPDGTAWWSDGPFFFGHRRLAIIDLQQGAQPMATDEGALVVTFNGEIYNYVELRRELQAFGHVFRTQSDTEVLLHGYRQWGTGMPARLKGMFAFALADRQRDELLLARDRFGEKPLFYTERPGGVSFASELRTLASMPDASRRLDRDALAAYLCLNYVPGEATLVSSIRRVAPASWRLYGRGGLMAAERYWSPPVAGAHDQPALTEDEVLGRLEPLLDHAVALTLRSDVPVGVFLSGGIDSALVSRSAVRSGRLSRAYCLDVEEIGYSEWPAAQETAGQLGIPITRVALSARALEDFLPIVEHADDPLADSSALAVWTLARTASQYDKVVLGGDGGDEMFGGYLTYQATLWHERVTSRLPMVARRLLRRAGAALPVSEGKVTFSYRLWRYLRAMDLPPPVAHFTWNGTWLPGEAASLLADPDLKASARDALSRLAAAHHLPGRPTLGQLQAADASEYLPNDILAKSDRMTMAHGLELRSPLLEPELAEFALRLPARFKLARVEAALPGARSGHSKYILRCLAARSYGVDLASARKQGFSIPVHAWLRGPARELTHDLLSPRSIEELGVLDAAAIRRVLDDHMSGRRSYGFELWGLMVLSAWHRARIMSAPVVPQPDRALEERRFPFAASATRAAR